MKYLFGLALLLPVVSGCSTQEAAEHDSHATERPVRSITHFSGHSELFLEYPEFVRGEESTLLAHCTDLETFQPVAGGSMTVSLSGGGHPDEQFTVSAPARPGIFQPVVVPQYAGERRLAVLLETQGSRIQHDLGTVDVCETPDHDVHEEIHAGSESDQGITFLKEQQWQVEFATAPAAISTLRASIPAPGVIRARPDGETLVSAPVSGRLIAADQPFPGLGASVQRNQILALLLPEVSDMAELSALELSVEEARISHTLARQERERRERLLAQEAVPERQVIEARNREQGSEAAMLAARRRLEQYQGVQHASGGDAADRVALRAPFAGVLTDVMQTPGQYVERGSALFQITNLDRLWLEVQIPEVDAGLIRGTTGAWVEIQGHDTPITIDGSHGGRVVTTGSRVDPVTRTVPLIFEFPNTGGKLKAGMAVRVYVLTGENVTGPVVPVSALLDYEGRDVIFVQTGGESFERRLVRPGIREDRMIHIQEGLKEGERIVTRGAYYVRLASTATATPAHGHAH